METIFALINHQVPAWVVVIMAVVQAAHLLLSSWSKIRRFALVLQETNRRLTYWVRRWLGISPTVKLTQKEYDALPSKDPNTLYLISGEPTD